MSLWTKEYEPLTAQELVINKKKILEISDFLQDAFNIENKGPNRRNILIISGPNGCGKTTLLRSLCKNMNILILEWETPFGLKEGLGTSFFRFITNSTFFPGINMENKRLILIKEFPSTLVQHNKQILDDIKLFLSNINQKTERILPIVFISTESRTDRNFLKLVLPYDFDIFDESKTKFKYVRNANIRIQLVKINPTPSTVLKTRLKRILTQRNILIGRSEDRLIEQICNASSGDLSHAINLLQLLFIGHPKESIPLNHADRCMFYNSNSNKKKRCKEYINYAEEAYISEKNHMVFGKELTYNIFRSIGKILYNKRESNNNSSSEEQFNSFKKKHKHEEIFKTGHECSNLRNISKIDKISYYQGFNDSTTSFTGDLFEDCDILVNRGEVSFDLEYLLINSGNDEETLILFLQENYIPFIGNPIDLIRCSEVFSWSDSILNPKVLLNNEEHLNLLVLSCISRTILYFNSIPINPCSNNSRTQSHEKVGFTNNFFSKYNGGNYKEIYSDKSTFRWYPKKPLYRTYISESKGIREEFQTTVCDIMRSNNINVLNCYTFFSKILFTDIFPYLNYMFIPTNNKINTIFPYLNSRLINFIKNWSRYTKYISLTHEDLVKEFNMCYNGADTITGEYISDEQLVSILETYEADIYSLFESNVHGLNIISRGISEDDNSSDDPIDDNF